MNDIAREIMELPPDVRVLMAKLALQGWEFSKANKGWIAKSALVHDVFAYHSLANVIRVVDASEAYIRRRLGWGK